MAHVMIIFSSVISFSTSNTMPSSLITSPLHEDEMSPEKEIYKIILSNRLISFLVCFTIYVPFIDYYSIGSQSTKNILFEPVCKPLIFPTKTDLKITLPSLLLRLKKTKINK